MIGRRGIVVFTGLVGLAVSGAAQAQVELPPHAECALFGTGWGRFRTEGFVTGSRSAVTESVVTSIGTWKTASSAARAAEAAGTIDSHLFGAMEEAGVKPAGPASDFTFARRVSLDLTGRVPAYERLVQFINDPAADKRSRYVDELLARSEWADKWTMFLGDLYKNVANNNQVNRFAEGRTAFYEYIRASLTANKKYDAMAREMISASGTNSWEQGELNWTIGGLVSGGPRTGHDNFDKMAVNVVSTFLGVAHSDCIMCHDGRRHLDGLSLWGSTATRLDMYGMAAFFARTITPATRVDEVGNRRYYAVAENPRALGYTLNTTTGNRPVRTPIGAIATATPEYAFGDRPTPGAGEPPRTALARMVTSDRQFARATVNYFWKEFFGIGLVEPVDQFDPARLDPDNPPPEPWTLQPSNARLLNALAQEFAAGGYDLKALMRSIVNSRAYQLSSWYDGDWSAAWETLYARKLARRLWAEEIADAVAQISNVPVTYAADRASGVRINWAMQLPETNNLPGSRTPMGSFLNSFFRGNRVDDFRRQDGSISQTLNLMNDSFVHQRTRASGTGDSASLARRLLNKYAAAQSDGLIDEMFLTVLSRPASEEERGLARQFLASATTNAARQARVEDLVWTLFNKVDFIFNY